MAGALVAARPKRGLHWKGRGPVGGTRTGTETTASGNDGRIATAAQDLPTQWETLR